MNHLQSLSTIFSYVIFGYFLIVVRPAKFQLTSITFTEKSSCINQISYLTKLSENDDVSTPRTFIHSNTSKPSKYCAEYLISAQFQHSFFFTNLLHSQ